MASAEAAPEPTYTVDINASPTAEAVDAHALEFKRLEKDLRDAMEKAANAAAPFKALKDQLVPLVKKFGSQHHEKSKLLHGILWEMMATFGQSTTQDAAAIERLRLALVKSKKARLLKKLFTKETRWRFNSNANSVIKTEKLTPAEKGLLLDCFDTENRTPTIDVREKKKDG